MVETLFDQDNCFIAIQVYFLTTHDVTLHVPSTLLLTYLHIIFWDVRIIFTWGGHLVKVYMSVRRVPSLSPESGKTITVDKQKIFTAPCVLEPQNLEIVMSPKEM